MRLLKTGNAFMLKYLRQEKHFVKLFRTKHGMRVWGRGGGNWELCFTNTKQKSVFRGMKWEHNEGRVLGSVSVGKVLAAQAQRLQFGSPALA